MQNADCRVELSPCRCERGVAFMKYRFDFEFLGEAWPEFVWGAVLTLKLTAAAIVLGLLFGTLCAVARTSGIGWLRKTITAYVEIIRNTPLLVQTFWLFFGLASLGFKMTAFTAALVALTVNITAYSSEIIRAGIESIRKGQIEAAESLGLTKSQILRDVILPPAIERVFPALTSQFVLMMLASSIMSQISAEELMAVAGRVQSETFRGFEIYLIVAGVYLLLAQLLRLTMHCISLFAFPRRRRLGTTL
jgi:polar amino acid transport system permease protein